MLIALRSVLYAHSPLSALRSVLYAHSPLSALSSVLYAHSPLSALRSVLSAFLLILLTVLFPLNNLWSALICFHFTCSDFDNSITPVSSLFCISK